MTAFEPGMKPVSLEEAKFFKYGEVAFAERDFKSRQILLRICMPNSLFQAVTPTVLSCGWVDEFRVREPVAAWLPQVTPERMNPLAGSVESAHVRVNMALAQRAEDALRVFQGVGQFLLDPSDIVPFLPMGTYVCFRFRCRIDDIPRVLEGVDRTPVVGVPEFQWALASVMMCVLEDFAAYERALTRA